MTYAKPSMISTGEANVSRKHHGIASLALVAMLLHGVLWASSQRHIMDWPLWIAPLGGTPLVWDLLVKLWHREFGRPCWQASRS